MNEAETRAEYLDPVLKAAGRGVVEGSRILREYKITPRHGIPEIADAMADLGEPKQVQAVFIRFQKFLYVSAA
jgi:hypothetical protein